MIWLQVGDDGNPERFDALEPAVDYLNSLKVGAARWRNAGFDTANFWGQDYVRLYRGDAESKLLTNLLPDDRVFVEDNLQPI